MRRPAHEPGLVGGDDPPLGVGDEVAGVAADGRGGLDPGLDLGRPAGDERRDRLAHARLRRPPPSRRASWSAAHRSSVCTIARRLERSRSSRSFRSWRSTVQTAAAVATTTARTATAVAIAGPRLAAAAACSVCSSCRARSRGRGVHYTPEVPTADLDARARDLPPAEPQRGAGDPAGGADGRVEPEHFGDQVPRGHRPDVPFGGVGRRRRTESVRGGLRPWQDLPRGSADQAGGGVAGLHEQPPSRFAVTSGGAGGDSPSRVPTARSARATTAGVTPGW